MARVRNFLVTAAIFCSILVLMHVKSVESQTTSRSTLTSQLGSRNPSCALNCPTGENDKICASNGVTYKNECRFNCAKARNSRLRLVKRGDCSTATLRDYRKGK